LGKVELEKTDWPNRMGWVGKNGGNGLERMGWEEWWKWAGRMTGGGKTVGLMGTDGGMDWSGG